MKTLIIAEVGNLHNGSLDLAKKLALAAVECGADVVKFQTHIFDAESLPDAPNPAYFQSESRKAYFERTAFSLAEWRELKSFIELGCRAEFLSSPFSEEAVDLLEQVGLRRYKIPSGEVNNTPLLEKVASTGKPILLSSGMSAWAELDAAVSCLRSAGAREITLFQCSSVYPCPPEKVGLNILTDMQKRYGLAVGLSDHTLGSAASVAAVVLGASVIEKHFTLSADLYGSDAKHSLTPEQFRLFVEEIRSTENMLASPVDKDDLVKHLGEMKYIFEKSAVAAVLIGKGTKITREHLAFKKPGDGIKANRYRDIIGKLAQRDIPANTKITEEMLEA